ncbi:MAG: insulinase family protein [Bacteroidales bacterium]|nr:insulinase family protein [Bacteroidales bacterium]
MKKLLSILMLLAFVGSMTFVQAQGAQGKKSDLTAKVPVDKKVKIGKLANGMTYYIRANKKPENRVQFRLVTNAGSILEDDDQQGLAHFCEHMAFNGTQYYKGNEMISTLQKNGIEFGRGINAWTAFDETVYYVELPADNKDLVEMGFKILDGWASKLLFDQDEIEHERGVILEEWRGGLGAQERLRKATWPIMLKGSRYADRLPIGLEEVIRTFQRPVITRFYNDWYRPDLQAVIIVGDIDVNAMEAKVHEYFDSRKAVENPRPRPEYDIPGNKEPLVAIATDKEATNASMMLFWKHAKAPQGTVGDYRASLVRNLVSGMLDDRYNELAEKATAPFIYAGGGYGGFLGRSCDAFIGSCAPKENRIEEATEAVLAEIFRAVQNGFTATELERQKEEMLEHYRKMAKEANKTNSNNFAQEYTNNFLEGEVIPGIMAENRYAKEFIPEITLEECNALIRTWVTDENFVYYLTAPQQEGYKVPTEQEVLKIYNRARANKYAAWVDNYKDEPLFEKQLAAVTPKLTKTNTVLDYKEYTCPNGVKFIVKKTELKDDEIQMNSFAWGGTSLYSDAEYYMASNAASFVDDAGIAQFSNTQLSKKLKGVNVSISPNINDQTQGFRGNCAPKDLETMLQLLTLYYEAPRKDKESFDKNIDQLRNQLKFIGENPQVVFIKKFSEMARPGDPRAITVPSEENIASLNLDRMYEIFRERFSNAAHQTFFFVGNIEDADINLIAKYLGNLPTTKAKAEKYRKLKDYDFKGTPRATAYKGTDNQGIMLMSGSTKGYKHSPKNAEIIDQLSACMEITALEIIREKMGGTYSPSVNVSYGRIPEPEVGWTFYINCNPDSTALIENAAMGILKQYINNGPDAETLAKVQEQQIINRQNSKQNNSFWMGQIMGSYRYNESRDYVVNDYESIVKSVTAKDIQAAAKKFIDLKHYLVVFLKPEAKPAE